MGQFPVGSCAEVSGGNAFSSLTADDASLWKSKRGLFSDVIEERGEFDWLLNVFKSSLGCIRFTDDT